MKKGAEIIVCTPGRMIDLLTANSGRVTNLKRVTYLVLDERSGQQHVKRYPVTHSSALRIPQYVAGQCARHIDRD